jgi:TetR/AcrR family acrAB operon transcriptional repressor
MFFKSERSAELAPIVERKQRERRHCLAQVEQVLKLAVARKQLPADTDTGLAARALHAYMAGIMYQWVLDPDAFDLATAAPALLDALLAGLRAAPPRLAAAGLRTNDEPAPIAIGQRTPGKA